MLSPRGSHGAHPLPAGGRCSRRGYCCPYCWPSGTTILYPRIWVGIYSVDGCGFTINPQHHPLPPSSQLTWDVSTLVQYKLLLAENLAWACWEASSSHGNALDVKKGSNNSNFYQKWK
ncbi:hypothetical protein SEVIR_6G161600v4 [Setaria viridis]|uniref:Uncharacterized protein n=1 Tax=Setaria viridis TaxID=4556 RepID=A0A4U6U790_SETVI|nr:hypothetical protein SEVIR_6G161600v2 [Setaria viridis]